MMEFKRKPRPSSIAGTWYSDDKQQLAHQIDGFINKAKISENEFSGELFGIVSPHAGYRYSGKTAGYAYRIAQGISRDIIVVLSPFHQYHTASLLTTGYSNYSTPLGEVSLAVDLMNELAGALEKEQIFIQPVTHDPEHALEIQLPFLQRAVEGNFQLMPLMVRTPDPNTIRTIAHALIQVLKGMSFLIVASTDLSHFYPLERAQQMDAEMLRRIKALDAEGVLSAEREGVASACGAASVAGLIYAARHLSDAKAYILNYSTSADDIGDTTSVVGYGSAAIYV